MQNTFLAFLAAGGLLVSILSILEKYVKWILSFCDIFGKGCRKALKFHLFGIPVSWYGAAYYLFLIILISVMEPWVNIKNGKEMGISAIPTFIINGQMISGVPSPEKFEKLIEKALRKASSPAAADN